MSPPLMMSTFQFQFTHPGRGATVTGYADLPEVLRFNSRTPGGVRPQYDLSRAESALFQFTHPGRGATFIH